MQITYAICILCFHSDNCCGKAICLQRGIHTLNTTFSDPYSYYKCAVSTSANLIGLEGGGLPALRQLHHHSIFGIPYELIHFGGAPIHVQRHDFMHCECSQTHIWNVLHQACSPVCPYGKRASKLPPVEHFEECCSRFTPPPHPAATKVYIACSACCDWLTVFALCRKYLTGGIPEPVLKQCRKRFLNYPTCEQRKSYILNRLTPIGR